ncbi:MAG: O-antigen ligase family protein [Actinobacteria bacterium]|nr:MAG: O-antigen ligase family protein [Actinomycetota bacterium]
MSPRPRSVLLDIPLAWDVNYFYRGNAPYPGGLNLSLTTIAVGGLYAIWVARTLAERRPGWRPQFRLAFAAVPYVALTALSIVVATDKLLSLFSILLLAQTFLVFLYLASVLRTRDDFAFVMAMLMIGVVLESLAIVVSFRLGRDFGFAGISGHAYTPTSAGAGAYRPGGTIGLPNVAGSFLGVVLVPLLSILPSACSRRMKVLAGTAFLLGVIALILTYSRGGWLAFGASLVFLLAVSVRRKLLKPWVPLAACLVVGALALPFVHQIAGRLGGTDYGAAAARIPLMQLAWDVIKAHPLLGVGVNNFSVVLPDYVGPQFTGDWLSVVHNQYMLVWSEAGIAALVAFLVFLGVILRRGWLASSARDPFLAPLALGLTAGMVGILPNMLVERFVNRPQTGLLWLLAGLLTALYARARSAEAVGFQSGRRARSRALLLDGRLLDEPTDLLEPRLPGVAAGERRS